MSSDQLSPDLIYLRTHLMRIDLLLSFAVDRARNIGFDFSNEFQGLYISDEEVERHLALEPGAGIWDGAPIDPQERSLFERQYSEWLQQVKNIEQEFDTSRLRLRYMMQVLDLKPEDLNILIVCLAPAIERRYERLYSFLQDDVTRRQPAVNFVLNLIGQNWQQRVDLLKRLSSDAPLIKHNLIIPYAESGNQNTTFNNYLLRVDPRIVNYILGVDHIPAALEMAVSVVAQDDLKLDSLILDDATRQNLRRNYRAQNGQLMPAFHFYGGYGSGKRSIAAALTAEHNDTLLEINLKVLKQGSTLPHDIPVKEFRLALREGMLRQAAILVSEWESVLDDDFSPPRWLWEALVTYPFAVFLSGQKEWEAHGTYRQRPVLRLHLEVPEFQERLEHWYHNLPDVVDELNPAELAYKFQLTGGQIRDAVYTARDFATWRGAKKPALPDLYAGSRAQSNRRLANLASKITPRYTWKRLILPEDRVQQLREISNQVKYAVHVYEDWQFGDNIANARGVTALFAGQSGTGKTMAAEVIANDLGIELYKIDLSTVVSKYIGETEKNLAAIFEEATQSNAILFFDEADALFGKRSEVKDSHDRYANIETGYLLQRMESYDGIAILATNLRQNLDEAFTRRLDFLIDFPFPEDEDRLRIWEVSFPANAPLCEDVNLKAIADRYRITGGNIRNAVLAAAFLAAADDEPCIATRHIMLAIRREYQKMGKLIDD